MLSNPDDDVARANAVAARADVVRRTMSAYRDGIMRAAAGTPLGRLTTSTSPVVADLFKRSDRDQAVRRELDEFTTLTGGSMRLFKRGVLDPTDPQTVLADLPAAAFAALPDALEHWRTSLVAPPPKEEVRLLDAVREFGGGVASFARVRALLIIRGPSDDPSDDLLLELKEIADAGTDTALPPDVHYDSVGERVVRSARAAWGRPDAEPRWGWTDWLGLPCQVRLETEGQKGVKVAKLTKDLGTPDAIATLGADMGTIIARVHTSGEDGLANARAIWKRIAQDPARFVEEQVEMGVAYADLVVTDHARFVRALHRPDGLRLGIPFDPLDAPSPDLVALYGTPPPLAPLPSLP
jgi:uncharacterized protein (DUF2252 family)